MPDVVMYADTLALAGASPRGAAARLRPVRLRGAQRDADDLRRLARDSAARGDRRPRGLRVRGPRRRRDDRRRARPPRARSRVRAARLPQAGRHEGDRAVGLPALRRRPPARERRRARDRRAGSSTAAAGRRTRPSWPGSGARSPRPELAYARAKELLAAGPQTCEGLKSAINLVFAEQGDGGSRSADRLARRADHRRPRSGPRRRSRPASPSCSTSSRRIPSRAASRT